MDMYVKLEVDGSFVLDEISLKKDTTQIYIMEL